MPERLTPEIRLENMIRSIIDGATKEHEAVFRREIGMLHFLWDTNTDLPIHEKILIELERVYQNREVTLARIEGYRRITGTAHPAAGPFKISILAGRSVQSVNGDHRAED